MDTFIRLVKSLTAISYKEYLWSDGKKIWRINPNTNTRIEIKELKEESK